MSDLKKTQGGTPERRTIVGVALAVICAMLLGGAVGAVLGIGSVRAEQPRELTMTAAKDPAEEIQAPVSGKQLTPAQVYASHVDAVVGIRTESTTVNAFGQPSSAICSGSGFIVTEDGYVVTNYHVVQGAKSIQVLMHSGESHAARMVGGYAENDVALLKMEGENFPFVTVGRSRDLVVGEQVVAIGNPLGELTYSMTVGYVSALDRQINASGTPINMLQTDAAINSGNSGGPVFDMNGHVVAIASAKYSGRSNSGAYIEGLSFAIPIDDVLDILRELDAHGYVTGRPQLGISARELDRSVAELYGLKPGIVVWSVEQGSCAEKAGLRKGDILTKFGDRGITGYNDLAMTLREYRAGDKVTVAFYRQGEYLECVLTLDEKDTRPAESRAENT